MTAELRTNWRSLGPWLLACPILLVASVLLLSPHNSFYQSWMERALYLALVSLPLLGVVAIFRQLRARRALVIAASLAYLLITLPMALLAAVFIGCSWANACF